MDNIVLFMRGPDDGQLRIALREGSGIKLDAFRERLRKALPERVIPWLAARLEQGGLTKADAARQAQTASFGFEPGDIVTEVMSFGSSTPIEVRVIGTDLDLVQVHAEKVASQMKRIPYLRDIQFEQTLGYPTVEVAVDREKAGLSGVNIQDVGNAVIVATSSSRFIALNYWQNPKTGFDYQVEVLVPTVRMTEAADVETLAIAKVNNVVNLMVRDVASVRQSQMPGEFDRSASQRFLSITANVEGEDMGRASRQVADAIKAAGKPPRGVRVIALGQLAPMVEMFEGARDRARGCRVRDPHPVDGLLPVPSASARVHRRGAWRAFRYRDHPLLHGDDLEHRVVHGLDHVPGRLGVELGHAGDLHDRPLEGWELVAGGRRWSGRVTACGRS